MVGVLSFRTVLFQLFDEGQLTMKDFHGRGHFDFEQPEETIDRRGVGSVPRGENIANRAGRGNKINLTRTHKQPLLRGTREILLAQHRPVVLSHPGRQCNPHPVPARKPRHPDESYFPPGFNLLAFDVHRLTDVEVGGIRCVGRRSVEVEGRRVQ